MRNLLTPARLAAAVGSLTGIGAVVASLLDVVPHESGLGRGLMATGGAIGTSITVAKFLEGQAGWEQTQAGLNHDLVINRMADPAPPTVAKSDAPSDAEVVQELH